MVAAYKRAILDRQYGNLQAGARLEPLNLTQKATCTPVAQDNQAIHNPETTC